jgi:hypothetical protein
MWEGEMRRDGKKVIDASVFHVDNIKVSTNRIHCSFLRDTRKDCLGFTVAQVLVLLVLYKYRGRFDSLPEIF